MRRFASTVATAAAVAAITTLAMLPSSPATARDHDDYRSAHSCFNPAGHVRGRCRHALRQGRAIGGRVLSVGGVLVQLARNNGRVVTIDEQQLLALGAPLIPGRYYSLRGYVAPNGLFYATSIASWSY
ncbi:MAG: hypothetical protein JOZ97_05360 [Candidatus Eremiobacteraeota bacterium]|nr:hypothetical protein [Candidatus Eremiobacteraeota bacterium]